MLGTIKPNRTEISRSFPVAGFTIQAGMNPAWFEVALATDPHLLHPENREHRTSQNFYSSRSVGPLPAHGGEAVYLVPPAVLSRFAGQDRLFYAVATFADKDRSNPQIMLPTPEATPYITISRSFSGQALRQMIGVPNHRGGLASDGYGTVAPDMLTWAGDEAAPGSSKPLPPPANTPAPSALPAANAPTTPATGKAAANGNPPPAAAQGYEMPYDDGFGTDFWAKPMDAPAAQDDDNKGITGPLPDDDLQAVPVAQSSALALTAPEYPGASRLALAHPNNYRVSRGPRTINRIVIHITDGGPKIDGTIGWFQNPDQTITLRDGTVKHINVSAHYIVGTSGEVVQMVANNDIAWHASQVNGDSIGIEHTANKSRNILPTDAEYCASATLVNWLCQQYNIPMDRDHIQGHSEASPRDHHDDCPNSVWDWDYYMGLVTSGSCYPRDTPPAQSQSYGLAMGSAAQGSPKTPPRNGHQHPHHPPAPSAHSGRHPSHVQAATLADITPMDAPSDPVALLNFMVEWQKRKTAWQAGVPDTTIFPHSAICHFEMTYPDGLYSGTGFYIGNNTLLTCAHNVIDWDTKNEASQIVITPGKNGAGVEPFGKFTVQRSAWDYHPNYDGTRSFDLAVIRVDTAAPNGLYFSTLEELTQSKPSPIIVCGYAAKNVDRNKQHLDADMIRTVEDETFEYNLQTEPGNSGSPVFYVDVYEDDERRQSVQEIKIVGVHVAGFDASLNRGCRLTNAKIQWINDTASKGRTASAGAVSQGLALSQGTGPNRYGKKRTARAMDGGATVAIASAIVGAVMTRVIDNKGDVNWELDQLQGLKYPFNDPKNAGNAPYTTTTTPVYGLDVENLIDYITADFEITWQWNGRALGNIQVTNTKTSDMLGWGLEVKENIMDDANSYTKKDGSGPSFAAIKLRFYFRFTRVILSDVIGAIDYTLYGDGTYDRRSRWTQT